MKTSLITLSLISAVSVVAMPVYADNSYIARGRVVESTPIIETVYEQKEVCRYVTTYSQNQRGNRYNGNIGDKLLGGVLGGAAGSAVGKGTGRDAAAGVGAIVGSEISAQDGGISEGEIIGGLAGGIIGNQVGKGSGKTAATAAGALLGAIVGDQLQHGNTTTAAVDGQKVQKKICSVEEFPKKIITGYDVTFEYDDYHFSQIMAQEPGRFIDINVNVQALEKRTSFQ